MSQSIQQHPKFPGNQPFQLGGGRKNLTKKASNMLLNQPKRELREPKEKK